MQSPLPVPTPLAICGVPGYAPPDGEGYHALVDGVKVYVPPEPVVPSFASSTSQSSATPEVTAVNRSLTKAGTSGKGWSWRTGARNAEFHRTALLANSSEASSAPASLANSFAALAVDPHAES